MDAVQESRALFDAVVGPLSGGGGGGERQQLQQQGRDEGGGEEQGQEERAGERDGDTTDDLIALPRFLHRLLCFSGGGGGGGGGSSPEERVRELTRTACSLSARLLRVGGVDAEEEEEGGSDARRRDEEGTAAAAQRAAAAAAEAEEEADAEAASSAAASGGSGEERRRVRQRRGGEAAEGASRPPSGAQVEEARGLVLRVTEFCYYAEKLLSSMRSTYHVARALCQAHAAAQRDARGRIPTGLLAAASTSSFSLAAGIARFSNMGESEQQLTGVQQLIIYVLNIMQDRGYRRCGADCYERVMTPDGRHATRAWKHACTIRALVFDVTRKELNFEQWINATKGKSNIAAVEEYLASSDDVQFPVLRKNRHVFAFRDGLYVTSCDALLRDMQRNGRGSSSSSGGGGRAEEGRLPCSTDRQAEARTALGDAFLPYGEHEGLVPEDVAACNYFDIDFSGGLATDEVDMTMRPHHVRRLYTTTTTRASACPSSSFFASAEEERAARERADAADAGWERIPTPHMQSIFDYQQFEPEVCEWAYALIGRLLYEVNEADAWQVMPFLKGQAGTGKSTLLHNVCRHFYDACDVGVLSNNIERKFGISALADKYLFVGNDIKSDLQLDQAEFQSIVSGESLQVAVKHQTARAIDWRVPGIMAGNESPAWVDNSGSIGRRVIVFEFMRKVTEGDAELDKKLQAETPNILVKCNRAYQALVRRVGARTVWTCLPEYFRRTKAELTEAINPLQHFMNSGKLRFAPDAYMPFDVWKTMFKAHCDENNFGSVRLTKEKYVPVIFDYQGKLLSKQTNQARAYPRGPDGRGPLVTCAEWCIGMEPATMTTGGGDGGGGGVSCLFR